MCDLLRRYQNFDVDRANGRVAAVALQSSTTKGTVATIAGLTFLGVLGNQFLRPVENEMGPVPLHPVGLVAAGVFMGIMVSAAADRWSDDD